jgi:hypothetical protein
MTIGILIMQELLQLLETIGYNLPLHLIEQEEIQLHVLTMERALMILLDFA